MQYKNSLKISLISLGLIVIPGAILYLIHRFDPFESSVLTGILNIILMLLIPLGYATNLISLILLKTNKIGKVISVFTILSPFLLIAYWIVYIFNSDNVRFM